jgi:hypothetical protein
MSLEIKVKLGIIKFYNNLFTFKLIYILKDIKTISSKKDIAYYLDI